MKQIKILGVLAIALTLGLTACGGKSGGESGGKQSGQQESSIKHTHEAAEGAAWQTDASKHWKDCKDNDGGKVDSGSHKWVKDESKTDVEATCQAEGKAYEKCSVCGYTRERTVSKAAHTYEQVDGADKVVWTKEATCTEGGEGEKECTVCHEKEVVTTEAKGHVYEQVDGADKVVWTTEATCEKPGVGEKECTVCHAKETVTAEALKHDLKLVGGEQQAQPGKATVRLYQCQREGCGVTYLGFKATEVTDASKERLVFSPAEPQEGVEQGARFFGHPIGNNVELDPATGDPSEGNEAVYSKEQTGDFFEYKFDLTADQVAALGGDNGCLLYCDATPADWMQQNNMDFFAKGSETDWTKAYYIDDDPAHYEEDGTAKEIEGWRYVLYVDGKYQDLDATVATNRMRNNNRGEFVLPYVFKLHTGENSISLRMAAGYRCLFYNFTFRPIVADEGGESAHVHKYSANKAGTLETEGCTTVDVYNCENSDASALRWEAKSYDASSTEIEAAASDGSIRFNRAQGKNGETDVGGHLVYKINSPMAVKDAELSFYIQAHNQNVAIFDAVSNDSGMGKDVDAEGKFTVTPTKRYALYVNDVRVELGEDPGASTAKAWFKFPAKFDLKAGENKIEVISLGGYRARIYNFQLENLPKINIPFKTWDAAAVKAGLSNNGGTEATGHYVQDGEETFTVYKIGTAGDKLTLTYNADAAGKAILQLYMTTKNSNVGSAGVWYQGSSQKTKVTLNGVELKAPAQEEDKNLQQWNCTVRSPDAKDGSSALACPVWVSLIELDLVAGENTIVVEYLGGGYSYWFGGAQLAK